MSKSAWVRIRDWVEGLAMHVVDLLKPSSDALSKVVSEDLLPQVKQIIEDAVKTAEATGGDSNAKFEAAKDIVVPALEALGIKLGKALLQLVISNAVIALGFSA